MTEKQMDKPMDVQAVERELLALLEARLPRLGVPLPPDAAPKLARYGALLADWNTRINLTGDASPETIADRLLLDSLAPLAIPGAFPTGASLIDVGSGAGLPGLPLAIARPDLHVTLLDSLQKRVRFLQAVTDDLRLPNVAAVQARAEDGAHGPLRERFDLAAARAVAALPTLMEYLLPYLRVGGQALCYKGPAVAEELAAAARAARLLGGGKPTCHAVRVPGHEDWQHTLVICPKTEKTLRQYPRKAGTPGREPLGNSTTTAAKPASATAYAPRRRER